jgi:hypothetical protein
MICIIYISIFLIGLYIIVINCMGKYIMYFDKCDILFKYYNVTEYCEHCNI